MTDKEPADGGTRLSYVRTGGFGEAVTASDAARAVVARVGSVVRKAQGLTEAYEACMSLWWNVCDLCDRRQNNYIHGPPW